MPKRLPGRFQRRDTQLAHNLPSRQAHNGSECRVGQLELCQLLYPHVGRHAGGRDLHDFNGLLTHYMRTQYDPRISGYDQLAEALSVAVYHCSIQVGVWDNRYDTIMSLPRLALGKPHAGIFGIGEASMRHHSVGVGALGAQDGVLGGHGSLSAAALYEHHTSGNVPGCEDMGHAGAQGVVDLDGAALAPDVGGRQVEEVNIAGPADRQDNRLNREGDVCPSIE